MITAEQIVELHDEAVVNKDWETVRECNSALTDRVLDSLDMAFGILVPNEDQPRARARCAEILGARAKAMH